VSWSAGRGWLAGTAGRTVGGRLCGGGAGTAGRPGRSRRGPRRAGTSPARCGRGASGPMRGRTGPASAMERQAPAVTPGRPRQVGRRRRRARLRLRWCAGRPRGAPEDGNALHPDRLGNCRPDGGGRRPVRRDAPFRVARGRHVRERAGCPQARTGRSGWWTRRLLTEWRAGRHIDLVRGPAFVGDSTTRSPGGGESCRYTTPGGSKKKKTPAVPGRVRVGFHGRSARVCCRSAAGHRATRWPREGSGRSGWRSWSASPTTTGSQAASGVRPRPRPRCESSTSLWGPGTAGP